MKQFKNIVGLLILPAAMLGAHAQTQLYKWVGPDGKVTYSDQPPPTTVKNVESRGLGGGAASDLPAALAGAVSKNPVTLYTGGTCAPCDAARTMLKSNGVPFSEKTVSTSEDVAKLKQLSGGTILPFAFIGNTKLQGYEVGSWRASLSVAGYPETSMLPKEYHYPAKEAAAPIPKPQPKQAEQAPAEQNKKSNTDFQF